MPATFGSEALISNPALASFTRLIGRWETTGTHPLVPGTIFHGRTSFEWFAGGAFLFMRSEIDEPQIPSGIAVFGSDDASNGLTMLYFDERGVSRQYEVEMTNDRLMWRREDPSFAQRCTISILDQGNRLVAEGEMSRNGAAWESDLTLTYVRMD